MGKLQGKFALVTGASGGIGRTIAAKLAQAGATVGVHYARREGLAEDTLASVRAAGSAGFAIGADLTSLAEIKAMFAALPEKMASIGVDKIDILINNAGRSMPGGIDDTAEEMFDHTFALDVKAPFFVTQNALPLIRDGGRIINISSVVAIAAYPSVVAYSAAKAALNAMTKSIAVGLAPRKITVNAVMPGATDTELLDPIRDNAEFMKMVTDMIPFGRFAQTEEIVPMIEFLASPDAGWVTGQTIAVSGGMHL